MIDHLSRARTFAAGAFHMLGNGLQEVWKMAMAHKVATGIVVVAGVSALTIVPALLPKPEAAAADDRRAVTLVRVGDVSGAEPISVIGEVRSKREAQVAPDISGTVAGVYRALGDTVGAGTVIAELKNDSQRAALAQAKAVLDKALSGTTIGTIGVENAKTAFASAEVTAAGAIESAYASLEDAVARKTDQLFSNPSNQPIFTVPVSNSQLVYEIEAGRISLNATLARHRAMTVPTAADAEIAELSRLMSETAAASAYLGDITAALSGAIPSASLSEATIAGYRADASGALASTNALRTALSGTIQDLKNKRAAVEIAEEGVASGSAGTSPDIAAAEAGVAAAEAMLERTFIRAPLSGSISRIDLEVGNFVNASMPVVYITNPDGLEVVAYVSGNDLANIAVGGKAVIAGGLEGTVTRAAKALDPVTKKAELRIGVPARAGLVSGQSTTVAITRATTQGATVLSIPLSALKITPDGAQVFTVDTEGTIAPHPVTTGTLRGSFITILEGVTADMLIIEDARGLKIGQRVIVNE